MSQRVKVEKQMSRYATGFTPVVYRLLHQYFINRCQ